MTDHTATANLNTAPAATTAPAGVVTGRISYEGDLGDGALAGVSVSTTPGVAVWNTATLGGWWMIEMPNGVVAIIQQIDTGPNPNTGRKFDFTNPALPGLGYTTENFPTDATASGVYIGTELSASKEGNAVSSSITASRAIAMLGVGSKQAAAIMQYGANNNIGQGVAFSWPDGEVTQLGTGASSAQSLNSTGPLAFLQGDTSSGNPLTVSGILSGAGGGLGELLKNLVSSSFWLMVLKILGGMILLGVGLYLLVKG